MSIAAKCDRCGTVFEWEKGCLTIEAMHVVRKPSPDGNKTTSWSEIDFCLPCSRKVLDAIGAAIQGNPGRR